MKALPHSRAIETRRSCTMESSGVTPGISSGGTCLASTIKNEDSNWASPLFFLRILFLVMFSKDIMEYLQIISLYYG